MARILLSYAQRAAETSPSLIQPSSHRVCDLPGAAAVTSSEPLWIVQNSVGLRWCCFLTRIKDRYVLLVTCSDGTTMTTDHHDGPPEALDRAAAMYRQLIDEGWMPASSS